MAHINHANSDGRMNFRSSNDGGSKADHSQTSNQYPNLQRHEREIDGGIFPDHDLVKSARGSSYTYSPSHHNHHHQDLASRLNPVITSQVGTESVDNSLLDVSLEFRLEPPQWSTLPPAKK